MATLLLLCCTTSVSRAASRPLVDVLADLQRHGAHLVFSTQWLRSDMLVDETLSRMFDPQRLRSDLRPLGLDLHLLGQTWVVVRAAAQVQHAATGVVIDANGAPLPGVRVAWADGALLTDSLGGFSVPATVVGTTLALSLAGYATQFLELANVTGTRAVVVLRPVAPIESIVVAASRYTLSAPDDPSHTQIDETDFANEPTLGDDVARAIARTPGVGYAGLSGKPHVRGGDSDEVLVQLDGIELLEPFHLKDFQSPLSTLDARAIDNVQIYTGALPASFGNRLSGVLDFTSLTPGTRRREASISPISTGLLVSQTVGAADVLLSARRSNLDYLFTKLAPRLGRPSFFDTFMRVGHDSANDRIEGSLLIFGDDIDLKNGRLGETARSASRSVYVWLRDQHTWNDNLTSTTSFSGASLRDRRGGNVDLRGDVVGSLVDRRRVQRVALSQQWRMTRDENSWLNAGYDVAWMQGRYDFAANARFGPLSLATLRPAELAQQLRAAPSGWRLGMWVMGRWSFNGWLTDDEPAHAQARNASASVEERARSSFLELGVRADRQSYLEGGATSQVSWRGAYSHAISPKLTLRFAGGVQQQPAAIDDTNIADGVSRLLGVQRAQQWVAAIEQRWSPDVALHAEVFRKSQNRVRQRFENLTDLGALLPELHFDRVAVLADKTLSQGVELGFAGTTSLPFATDSQPLRLSGAYAYGRADEHSVAGWRPRTWDQRHSLSGAIATQWNRWDVSIASTWHSGGPITQLVVSSLTPSAATPAVGPRNGGRLPAFFSLDLQARRDFRLYGLDATVQIDVFNATNHNNIGGYTYRFDEGALDRQPNKLLPILPSITLRVALPE